MWPQHQGWAVGLVTPNSCRNYTIESLAIRAFEAVSDNFCLDAFKQGFQSGPVHFLRRHLPPIRHETTLLESLGPHAKTRAIPVEDFHLRRTAVDEDEQTTAQGIQAQSLARQRIEAVKRLAHINRLAVKMNPDLAFGEEHQW